MSVSLVKIPVPASNAVPGARVRLGPIPVQVISNEPYRPGYVLIVGLTLNGATVAKVLPAGTGLATVPPWVYRAAE